MKNSVGLSILKGLTYVNLVRT